MPDIRYALRNGDKTSSNGTLMATGQRMFHHDVTVGVEGDYATCPACKAGGPVMNDCHPSFDIQGKQILVSGARVYCRCAARPVVIPSQCDFSIEVQTAGPHTLSLSSQGLGYGEDEAARDMRVIEQYYELVDADTDKPEYGYRYDLYIKDQPLTRNAELRETSAAVRGDVEGHIVLWLDKPTEGRA
ncbi:PAAR domain-containing protein [Cupriavidus alkaliphilus]|uniref:PAAR domain-containing protein n=1 Tax=Cupriavidus alkaliphilus TaxID=942866 RepID=UPI0016120CA3|nr:PAAR domain-containing protein [Cupriavidus alkaliphilus]MBB2920470.1 putative Zn-binding protein involved in type VI secretion [Cupriavidus alkaliphilus]MBB3015975.1 putative Zn-binding protein involved in type VI secretion [Cupriavidus alkaliphilus]